MEIINEIPFGLFRSNICNSMSEPCRMKHDYSWSFAFLCQSIIIAKETLNLEIINNVMAKYMIAGRIKYDNKQW